MAEKWYPVIDYLECVECGECSSKCPHGVFDMDKAPSPVVIHPEYCIDRCHGCGDLCPQGAITYVGDDTGWIPHQGAMKETPCGCGCIVPEPGDEKGLKIQFLYLDLNTCVRCKATDSTLLEAVKELTPVLETLGFRTSVEKVLIETEEMAEQYRFVSSPTILVNGADICREVVENNCKACGDLCGDDVDCRVFVYEGQHYEEPPKAMVVDGILRSLYVKTEPVEEKYQIPQNLKRFFEGKNREKKADSGCCCCGNQC